MDLKDKITNRFDKGAFLILDEIDPLLKEFIFELNKSKNITTFFSCEGHSESSPSPYIYFNVNSDGWDIFWNKIAPELIFQFENKFISDLNMDEILEHGNTVAIKINITDNVYNAGISIHGEMLATTIEMMERKKSIFWEIMFNLFLKYFHE